MFVWTGFARSCFIWFTFRLCHLILPVAERQRWQWRRWRGITTSYEIVRVYAILNGCYLCTNKSHCLLLFGQENWLIFARQLGNIPCEITGKLKVIWNNYDGNHAEPRQDMTWQRQFQWNQVRKPKREFNSSIIMILQSADLIHKDASFFNRSLSNIQLINRLHYF